MASTRQIRLASYPHNAFRNAFTVSTEGEGAVKYFGFAAGNGSGLLVCPRSFRCSAGAGGAVVFGAVPVVPVCAPAMTETLRTDANPANIHFEIFKESFLRHRSARAALLLHLNLDRYGKPSPGSERFFCYFQHRSRLLALIFTALNQSQDGPHEGNIHLLLFSDLFRRAISLHVCFQNRVQYLIWRQRVSISLLRAQFCGRRLFDGLPRNHLALAVQIATQRIDLR